MSEVLNPTPEEKVAAVKAMLYQQLNGVYQNLAGFVRQLPIDEKLKEFSLMNLDQGVMWIEQGIKKLNFTVENQAPQPVPPQPEPVSEQEQSAPADCATPPQPEGEAA